MPQISANALTIEYDTFGSSTDRPLLLVMGLGSQMTRWNPDFCGMLADAGHYVVRFDNRDVGLSTHLNEAGLPDMAAVTAALLQGQEVDVPYTLEDMADDTAALIEGLALDAVHVCGASLGGMVAQTLAIRHPRKVRSLTSIMSSTGNRELPPATPEAMAALLTPAAPDRAGTGERAISISKVIGSPGYPADPEEVRARAMADYDRAFDPAGVARQMAAASVQADRRAELSGLSIPALVIHGKDDPLVPVTGGIDTHEAIPDSELCLIDGMGHDLPRQLWPEIVQQITLVTEKAG
ncbi:MAG: alpha/beta hydrolase [Pseudomonadota bacterium]